MAAAVYHLMPPNMVGEVLYPLNRLKEIDPGAYEFHRAKYKGREAVTRCEIPRLGCLWNDVLQFSPCHPEQVRDAMRAAGYDWRPLRWLALEPERLGMTPLNAVLWAYPPEHYAGAPLRTEHVFPFSAALVEQSQVLPDLTKTYYQDAKQRGDRPLLFCFVPHVLFAGNASLHSGTVLSV